ncbi:UPF0481 protein At3g47200-like [Hevea brasiliensis]|uniref:UPF0481 protein At3g47200-like n=1 Tax=Hevea brasiliensis TaxID=3981 RepID=UPI0025FA0B2E|nr:UPF0481 protein At3g47200-like [Hevea brasiliensis]
MEHEAFTIVTIVKEEEINPISNFKRKGKSLASDASSSLIQEDGEIPVPSSSTLSSLSQDEHQVPAPTEIQSQEEPEQDEAALRNSVTLIERRLQEKRQAVMTRGKGRNSSVCIFRFPPRLGEINPNASQPELVSIGPYHRGKDHLLEFEDHKWLFLEKFLSRSSASGRGLRHYLSRLRKEEVDIINCYSDVIQMSSDDFVEMILLDGCFIIELLIHLNQGRDIIDDDDPIFTRPWLIPILIRDLLKLDNQLHFFVLDFLYQTSGIGNDMEQKLGPLPILALRTFDQASPRPMGNPNQFFRYKGEHLLHLVYSSLVCSILATHCDQLDEYCPSDQSIQCVTQLRPSGVKFKSTKRDSFLDINFKNQVLEIPSITVNDFTSTLLINCVALKQCQEKRSKYFTEYVSFMSCLISQPRDVALLCSDGIVTRFSKDDRYVVDLFTNLGKNTDFNIRDSYLSKQFREVESYYSSNWATIRRTYFSSPWSFISLSSAILLLVLTMTQTVTSVLTFKCQLG